MEIVTSQSENINESPLEQSVKNMLKSKSMLSQRQEDRRHLENLNRLKQRGRIELIMGPMFAGKSTELLRRIKRQEISGKTCLSIKYRADTRYSDTAISTHDRQIHHAISCSHLSEVKDLWKQFEVVGVDEGQFFEDIYEFSIEAAKAGKIVIMSALNGTYEQKGWSNILSLIPQCEKVKKLSSICKLCGDNANFTFRNLKVEIDALVPQIGGSDMYMPLCRQCYDYKESEQNKPDVQILLSESKSTNFGDSVEDAGENCLDMSGLRMVMLDSNPSSTAKPIREFDGNSPPIKNMSVNSNHQPSKSQMMKTKSHQVGNKENEPSSPILKNFQEEDLQLRKV